MSEKIVIVGGGVTGMSIAYYLCKNGASVSVFEKNFPAPRPKDMIEHSQNVVYVGADVHERETQLAVFEPGGTLLQEERVPTKDLQSYVEQYFFGIPSTANPVYGSFFTTKVAVHPFDCRPLIFPSI